MQKGIDKLADVLGDVVTFAALALITIGGLMSIVAPIAFVLFLGWAAVHFILKAW